MSVICSFIIDVLESLHFQLLAWRLLFDDRALILLSGHDALISAWLGNLSLCLVHELVVRVILPILELHNLPLCICHVHFNISYKLSINPE